MTISIEIKGLDDLKDLANSINKEQEIHRKLVHLCEYFNHSDDGDFDHIDATVDPKN